MKLFKVVLVLLLVFTSCKSSKNIVGNSSIIKNISARKVSKKHIASSFDKNTIEARLRVAYKDAKSKQKLNVKLRIDKDKVIWMSVTATALNITVARVKITPISLSYYEKINKTYFKGNFELLKNILGADVNFSQLQNMLIGETIFDLKAQKYKSVVDKEAHLLLPVQQKALFDILFWVNPNHFKLDQQELRNAEREQSLKIAYKKYTKIDEVIFPKRIEISAKGKGKFTSIHIDYKTVVFNKRFSTPFRVPNGYKQVVF